MPSRGVTMKIGFIGLGQMGLPMFRNLIAAGHDVIGFDSSVERNAALRAQGLNVAASPGALPSLDVLITMLPNGKVVRDCLLGSGGGAGLAGCVAPGGAVVDMSSCSPADTLNLADALRERGLQLVDAPVSGSVPKANAGTLTIMLGADDALAERVMPVLTSLGSTVIRTGKVGSAHAMKALNNYVYAAGLLAASEALMLGKALDLKLDVLVDVMNASSGRNVATETKLKQHMLENGDFKAGFALHLMAKDLGIAHSLRALTGLTPPQLSLCHDLWQEACSSLPASADNTEIYRFLTRKLHAADEAYPANAY